MPTLGCREPLSLPIPVSTPITFWMPSARFVTPCARSCSPVITVASPGISSSVSGLRVAETTTDSLTGGTPGCGVGDGAGVSCASARPAQNRPPSTRDALTSGVTRFRMKTESIEDPSFLEEVPRM